MALLPLREIVDVPALKVRFVLFVKIIVGELDKVRVEEPNVIVLVFVLLELTAPRLTLKFPVSNVPLVTVKVEVVFPVSAFASVQPPPTPSKVISMLLILTPFMLTVFPVVVALKRISEPSVPLKAKLVAGNAIEP